MSIASKSPQKQFFEPDVDFESITTTSTLEHELATTNRWHPKLTIYRLVALSTTIGLGTAKAILSALGNTSVPVTLEWISGVVIFLILQSLSTYDGPDNPPPRFLSWMFTVDCMDFVWRFLAIFSVPRRVYRSDERVEHIEGPFSRHPPVTIYRLLVSSAVVCFGMTKAVLAYTGYSTAANWMDWSLGVLFTTLFYWVGLYENNAMEYWEGFFQVDYSSQVGSVAYGAFRALINVMGVAFFTAWIVVWVYYPPWTWESQNPNVGSSDDSNNLTFLLSFRLYTLESYKVAHQLTMTIVGVISLFIFLRQIAGAISRRISFRPRIFRQLSGILRAISYAIKRAIQRVSFDVAFKVFFVCACIFQSLMFLGSAVPTVVYRDDIDVATYILDRFFMVLSLALSVVFGLSAWRFLRNTL